MHCLPKWHSNARNPVHDFIIKLSHAYVATLAALAGEMTGMCDTWVGSGEDLIL